jgi:UDP-N-acetylmuramoyl-tripeptide--D-alanyl-D-alanine ligase
MLIESLPLGGTAVLNADDPFLNGIKSGKEQITFGLAENADVRAKNVRLWPDLPSFELQLAGDNIHVRLPVYGKFNIYNALAAAAAAHKLGIKPEMIARGIEQFTGPKWRMEKTQLISGAIAINDAYNANPSSMKESIENLVQSFPDREKILVLGDMLELGEEAEKQHQELGRFISAQPVSRVMLFGSLMEKTYEELKNTDARYFHKKEELAIEVKKHLNSDCVVLFKASRGMKFEEIVESVLLNEEMISR